jgi:hypothetical protein
LFLYFHLPNAIQTTVAVDDETRKTFTVVDDADDGVETATGPPAEFAVIE